MAAMKPVRSVENQWLSKQDPYLARMWRRIIIAAAVGLVPVVVPLSPAIAAVPVPAPAQLAPAQVAPEQDCEQVLQQAQRAALAARKGGKVPCVRRVTSPMA